MFLNLQEALLRVAIATRRNISALIPCVATRLRVAIATRSNLSALVELIRCGIAFSG